MGSHRGRWPTGRIRCLTHLKTLAVQGEVIYQDDTHVPRVSLIAANRQAQAAGEAPSRSVQRNVHHGVWSRGKVPGQSASILPGAPMPGRTWHALLTQREAGREKPMVMSVALVVNATDEGALIRCHCLARGRRKVSELEEVFPEECACRHRGAQAGVRPSRKRHACSR